MPITVENKEYSIVKFVMSDPLVFDDLKKVLGLITSILDTKKPFSFYVHCKFRITPSASEIHSMTSHLISWMRTNERNIMDTLKCSAIIISSSTFASIFNGIFRIKPTIKPNIITTDYDKAEKFVQDTMIEYFRKKT